MFHRGDAQCGQACFLWDGLKEAGQGVQLA